MLDAIELAPDQVVVWEPSPKQVELLECDDFEVLYGGAAGGGKTDGLLVDAWCTQHNGPNNKHHRAVIFRKSFPELKDLIDRANELFPQFIRGVRYDKNEHTFITPAGAKLELAYCANDADRFQYRGRNWNYLGFEELTLWSTPIAYTYLTSRCRTTDRSLPRYVRSTSNPDGPGQAWVMKRWAIAENGAATVQEFEREFEEVQPDGSIVLRPRIVRRRFIPAKLKDNKYLAGTGYRETLLDLPPDDREALLEGKWTGNRVRGAYFQSEMQRARVQGRILPSIPHLRSVPVNTFWDLGHNDTTAIWFHQYSSLQNRFIHAYEDNGKYLDYFSAYLQRLSNERGYVYGTHYLPHDAENERLVANSGTGKSILSQLKSLLPSHKFVVVPRVDHKFNSIQQARAKFDSCWFDAEECSDGLAALDAYRKKWNARQEVFLDEPEHDRFSNYADAFQQFGMADVGRTRASRAADTSDTRRNRASNWRAA